MTEQRGVIISADTSSGVSPLRNELLVNPWLAQILCYRVHVCVPPNPCIEALAHQSDVIRLWGLWEVIRIR